VITRVLSSAPGGVQLQSMKMAAESLLDWARLPDRDMTDEIVEAGNAARRDKPAGEKLGRKAKVNDRMAGTMIENSEAMGWNSSQWAKHLKCGRSTVVETQAWKKLESARLQAKAERMKDRNRKPKASDSQRE